MPSVPQRWHVYGVALDPRVGTKPGKQRPWRVRIPAVVCGLTRQSDILVDQMLAWDITLFRRDLGPVPESVRDEVKQALLEFLDLV